MKGTNQKKKSGKKMRKLPLFLLAASLFATSPSKLLAAAKPGCNVDESYSGKVTKLTTSEKRDIENKRFSLKEMIEQKLLVQSPINLMHSGQKTAAWLNAVPAYEVKDPIYNNGTRKIYPTLSGGAPELTDGLMIVGNYEALEQIGAYFEAQAEGNEVKGKALLLAGTSGTGKSELPRVFSALSSNLSKTHPFYYRYTFEWVGLENIPDLRFYYQSQLVSYKQGNKTVEYMSPIEAPIDDSPFVLLPKSLQEQIITEAEPIVKEKITSGLKVFNGKDPITESIYNKVIAHYQREYPQKYGELTDEKVIEILDNHIKVKRIIREGKDIFPLVSAQGKDVDLAGLFVSDNPIVKITKGPKDAHSYHYNGKVLRGHGGVVLFDEFMRNPQDLIDYLLESFESRKIELGGSQVIQLDYVPLVITNTESIEKAIAEGGQLKATIDRMTPVDMNLGVVPQDIARTMVLMMRPTQQSLKMKKIGPKTSGEKWVTADINKLYPIPQSNGTKSQKLQTHESNYALSMEYRGKTIDIPPHTLEAISYIISATRIKTSLNEVNKEGLGHMHTPTKPVFRDPIVRIRYFIGDHEVPPSVEQELFQLHHALKEGLTGISNRDAAGNWIRKLFDYAVNKNFSSITYDSILHVLNDSLLQKKIAVTKNSPTIRNQWLGLAERVFLQMIIPSIEEDIILAYNSGSDEVAPIYNEIKQSLLARNADPYAKTYDTQTGTPELIDDKRLARIKEIFHKRNGQPLSANNLISMQGTGQDGEFWKPLRQTILEYLSEEKVNSASIDKLWSYTRNNGNVDENFAQVFDNFSRVMIDELGYSEESIQSALNIVRQFRNKKFREENARQQ